MKIFKRTFGPRHTEKELRGMNNRNELHPHCGCWINEWDCGDDCVMGMQSGAVEIQEKPDVRRP